MYDAVYTTYLNIYTFNVKTIEEREHEKIKKMTETRGKFDKRRARKQALMDHRVSVRKLR